MTTERPGQYIFDDDGELHLIPTPLTEGPEAWGLVAQQNDIELWAAERDRLAKLEADDA